MTGADDRWAAYNRGDEAQNAELLEAVTSWAQGHARENPRHRTRETLTDPGSCRDCPDRASVSEQTAENFPRPRPRSSAKWVDLFGIDPDYCDGMDVNEWLDEQRGEA